MLTEQQLDNDHTESEFARLNPTLAIFFVSVLGLFLEMMLIRWIGTEVRIFAYLQNTVLVVCFLGLGMGCFTCRKPVRIRRMLIALVLLTGILAVPLTRSLAASISDRLGVLGDLVIWHQAISRSPLTTVIQVASGLILTFGLMILLWEMFVPLGRLLGRLMDDHPRTIVAYSVNVAGSLAGIWLFVALSALYWPPVLWFATAGVLLLYFLGRGRELRNNLALTGLAIGLAWFAGIEPQAERVAWSPYQKLVLERPENRIKAVWAGDYLITVNNTGYQGMIDLSDEAVRNESRIDPEMHGLSQYDVPLLLAPGPNNVLVVGAGSGNDVAGALRGGAGHVTAVEIDPAIIEMGRAHHPEQPYQSPAVTVVNDDARSFFATTDQKFDLIIFGLLDSHTTTAMTNARLDHYVYTRESLARARTLLTDNGVMVLSFEAQKAYIADRMAGCLTEVFGEAPLSFRVPGSHQGWGGAMFVCGHQPTIQRSLAASPRLAANISEWQSARSMELSGETMIASDDWPYIYLKSPSIPTLYFLLGGLMVALVAWGKRRLSIDTLVTGWKASHWHFFFMGAAFLLLEVQNISKAAVVLGNTWWVNAVIISGILGMILLANLTVAVWKGIPHGLVYAGLIGSCGGLYFIDISTFAFLPYATKAMIVGTLTTLPMLFSGIVFIQSFQQVERRDIALGANLIGSLVGGLAQSVTFVIGIKSLLLVVTALYLAALATRPRATQSRSGDNRRGTVANSRKDDRSSGVDAAGAPAPTELEYV